MSIGTSPLRNEDPVLLRGEAAFTADVGRAADAVDAPGAVVVGFVRSPFAHAQIRSIDASEATSAPGVLAVYTAADVAGLTGGTYSLPLDAIGGHADLRQPLLPKETVRFAGQVVAVVAAESASALADALELVDVDYDPLDAVLDLDDAPHLPATDTTAVQAGSAHSSFEQAIADAEVVVSDQLWNPRQMPAPMEARTVLAQWSDGTAGAPAGQLTVWAGTQTPHAFRRTLAEQFGLEPTQIRVIAPAVGGGFGGKTSRSAEEHLVPFVARALDRPARWDDTRSEYFLSATAGRGERIDLTLAGTSEGSLTALRMHVVKDTGAYALVGAALPSGYSRFVASGCYDIPIVAFSTHAVRTNRPPTSAFRGAGRSPAVAALERMVDRFAHAIGMDPVEVRRKNLIAAERFPFETPTGARYDPTDHHRSLDAVLEQANYAALRDEQALRRAAGSRHALGIGVASYLHMTAGAGGEDVRISLELDGTIKVVTGTTSQGHGHAITWAQLVADAMGVPLEAITVVEGDTDEIDAGIGAVGSRSAQTAGIAVHQNATELLGRAKDLAARHLEANRADIVVSAAGDALHVIGTPARSMTWSAVAAEADAHHEEMACGERFDAGEATYPAGCHLAIVEVDLDTFEVEIVRYIAADDVGPRLHPVIVGGQLHGGIASGAAQVLGETMEYDSAGNPITANFADYAIASIDQFPLFETIDTAHPTDLNPLGFKGVGESGTVGATPAVHNAIVDALAHLGVDHVDLPCTSLRLWEAVRAAKARSSAP